MVTNDKTFGKGPSVFDRATMLDALDIAGIARPASIDGFIRCPFHHPDNTPSFKLLPNGNQPKRRWHCFAGCGEGGIADFLINVGKAENDAQAALVLEEHFGIHKSPKAAMPQPEDVRLMGLHTVAPQRIDWLWRGRIPKGKVTILCGDPGVGKSFATLAIAAAVTHGNALPDGDRIDPANVILWNGEDGLGDTIRPRADACGVNLERCHVVAGRFGLGRLDWLSRQIEECQAALVIIDPIAALLSGVDSFKDTEIRAALQPLVDMADATNAAVLIVMHLRKAEAERALYRVGGSIGFTGLARSVLLVAADPENGRKAIAPMKHNLAAPPASVEFRIDAEGQFWWNGTANDLTADHLLRPVKKSHAGAVDSAEHYLTELLANGPRPTKDIEALCEERMLSTSSVDRARRKLGVVARRSPGRDGKPRGEWMLELPDKGCQ